MLHCIAIDDEPLALELLKRYVSKIPELNMLAGFVDVTEAELFLKKNPVDLLLLDIEMPDKNGVTFYKGLEQKPSVIFTTAYRDYGAEGFELDAIDYMLKPFSFSRFQKAVSKFFLNKHIISGEKMKEEEAHVYINADYKVMKVPVSEIIYIEADNDYINIVTNQRAIKTLLTLKAMEEKLPFHQFTRVHKKYIVANRHISYIQYRKLALQNDLVLPVGDTYQKAANLLMTKTV